MIDSRQLLVCGAILVLGQTSGITAYGPEVRTNLATSSYVLQVGHVTFDSPANVRINPAFSNLIERLKQVSDESHPRPWRTNAVAQSHTNHWLQPVDIDVALGSDYQVLNWLQTGSIDAAMICPTALQLYSRWIGGVMDLVSFGPPDGSESTVLYRPKLRSFERSRGQWLPRPDPEGDFQSFLSSITNSAPQQSAGRYRLVAPSHLSAAGFIAPVAYANKWRENVLKTSTHSAPIPKAAEFWKSFFAQIEFSLGSQARQTPANGTSEGTILIEFSSDNPESQGRDAVRWSEYTNVNCVAITSLTNLLVTHSAVAKALLSVPVQTNQMIRTNSDPVIESLWSNQDLRPFLQPKFTIPELLNLVREDQADSGQRELAVVLSGGGVKAAYQSALIDYLYSTNRNLLSNATNTPGTALRVKSVVGNSGGALLGFFVAGLRENDSRNLSKILWAPRGRMLTDRDIFGNVDLPRWASFVVCVWVFIAVLRLGHRAKNAAGAQLSAGESEGLPWFYWVIMLGMLILTPLLLRLVNGEYGVEHVPVVEGLFYFVCQCLMLFIDNCVVTKEAKAGMDGSRRWKFWTLGTLLFVAGLAIAILPFTGGDPKWWSEPFGKMRITRGGFGFCTGILICWGSLILWTIEQHRFQLHQSRIYVRTVFATIGIIGLTYLTMWLLVTRGVITFLELTPAFWIALVLLTAVWSSIYVVLGKSKRCPPWFANFFAYQRSRHPSGTFGLTRLVRMHLLFTFGFFCWNVVIAPAVYGNASARGYLVKAVAEFVEQDEKSGPTNFYALQTLYAAPANDLAGNRERYFFFYPPRADLSNTVATVCENLNKDALKRWHIYDASINEELFKKVVFASGSPFPIFAPHAIELEPGGVAERLVDGGYAHNVPLEAARQIGARQALVLYSSPISNHGQSSANLGTNLPVIGQLSRNIPRLVGFLFEHSQVADRLSHEGMFIVSLSPNPTGKWPSLFDFRQSTVSNLLVTAQQDTTNRIGQILAHGPPAFLTSIRMHTDPE